MLGKSLGTPGADRMRTWTLTSKLVATGVTFLALALASTGLNLWVSWKLEGGAAAVNEAGRLRMMTYRLALQLREGDPAAARHTARSFDAALLLLEQGDPSRPLSVPWSAESTQRFDAVRAGWSRLSADWLAPAAAAPRLEEADVFVRGVDRFVAAIEAALARWTAILHAFELCIIGLAIASAVALMYAGYLLVLNPVARLQRGLRSIQEGQLGTRIPVDSTDEFGQLAAGFNAMAQTLESLYRSLEERVRDKTARLEVKRQRLSDLYEVSRFLAHARTLDELARGFAAQVRRIARADAAAVRWSDRANSRYMLLAGDNLPASLSASEKCLPTGSCRCGQPAGSASTRVIPIQPADAAPLSHCASAGFRAVVSVPVKLHDEVLGEVDLFYRDLPSLADDERVVLDTLASPLAGAMESLRASALQREAAVSEERSLIARELHDSIAQSLAFLKIQVKLLRESLRGRDEPGAARALDELDAGVRESLADVRELLVHFRTRTAGEDIAPALATTVSKFRHQTGREAELQIEGDGMPLPPDVQVQVLHIVQEALSNVRKHANAHKVQVRVRATPHWRFEVTDDGVGFDPAGDRSASSSVGLRIMQERAERIGARVSVRSAPGRPRPSGESMRRRRCPASWRAA